MRSIRPTILLILSFVAFTTAWADLQSPSIVYDAAQTRVESAADFPAFRRFVDRKDGSYLSKRDQVMRILTQRGVGLNGLAEEEAVAIYIYTDNRYSSLNNALRSGGEAAQEYLPFAQTLISGLRKLPDEAGTVIRGTDMPESVLADHQPGRIVRYRAFTSSSRNLAFGGHVQMKIFSRHGKFIESYSACKGQNEVLFAPSSFRVLQRTDRAGGQTDLLLEEVETQDRW